MQINKMMVIGTLLFNNRLKRYEEYIEYAKKKGYEIISLEKFYNLSDRRSNKHFIMRHDVDSYELSTRKMFEKEKKMGISSTYYFRKSTVDKHLIDEMIDADFEVGFHFETIANYVREKGNVKKNQIDYELMSERLKCEIQEFEMIIGHKIHSICSHGADENINLGVSNNTITEERDMCIFGVDFEAYSEKIYKDIDCHIMDCTITRGYGFAYYDNPYSAVDEGFSNILFLSHPEHWYDSKRRRKAKIRDIVKGKAVFRKSKRMFKRISKG